MTEDVACELQLVEVRRKRVVAGVTQPGLLFQVFKYMYTSILNSVLINSSQFAIGAGAYLESLRPQICTPAEILLAKVLCSPPQTVWGKEHCSFIHDPISEMKGPQVSFSNSWNSTWE